MRTKLFWQHGTFNAFEFLYGILYLSIYIEYWLTQLGVISMLVDGESIVPPPLWHALLDNYGALLI